MHLFLVHCGYYDREVALGMSECHANFFVVAASFAEARQRTRDLEGFRRQRMHIDTMQRIDLVDGHVLSLAADASRVGETVLVAMNGWSRRAPDAPPRAPSVTPER